MTSGEWDLNALKALEEEEQKEFLALSQKSLFEPPSPPGVASVSTSPKPVAKQTLPLAYAQLHPHLLKLPTINEYHLNAAAKRNSLGADHGNGSGGVGAGRLSADRLKFTRALSLSAHSLNARGASSGGFGKKLKSKLAGTKSSGSLSPSHYSYSVSPIYTPPPIRRCATLHHTQPVRKTFKTLQQLERQKQERRHQQQNQSPSGNTHRSPQSSLSKTFWKYGANSTAASIIGQRAKAKRGQLQTNLPNLESNTTDDRLPAADAEAAIHDFEDIANETGSCSVPLPNTDSNELMRLMLTAASTAVTTESPSVRRSTQPDVAATGGGGSGTTAAQQQQPASLTLARRCQPPTVKLNNQNEAVAYEAFHTFNRRKSFSAAANGRTLLRAVSLTAKENQSPATSSSVVNNRKMLKSTSVDAASTAAETEKIVDYKTIGGGGGGQQQQPSQQTTVNGSSTAVIAAAVAGAAAASTSTTSVVATTICAANNSTPTIKTNHMCNLPKKTSTTAVVLKALAAGGAGGAVGVGLHFNELNESHLISEAHHHHHHHHQHQHQHQHRQLLQEVEVNGVVCYAGADGMLGAASPPLIDDELEQHIKHCSCSCNHMGYGNSMDYQVSCFTTL